MSSAPINQPLLKRPSWSASLVVCTVLVAIMGWLRLSVLADDVVPLAFGLPLLACLWTRNRLLLWLMVVALAILSLVKFAWVISPEDALDAGGVFLAQSLVVCELLLLAGVIHLFINAQDRLDERNRLLARVNADLAAANQSLAAREEQIMRQNEELVSQSEELRQQTEELEQQTEELEQQSGELEQQSEELQQLNEQLARREKAMEILLEAAPQLRRELDARSLMARICEAALEVMENDAVAAAVVEKNGDEVFIRGHHGFGEMGMSAEQWRFEHSFAALVMDKGRTACIPDLDKRPDIDSLQPRSCARFRSILASPMRVDGQIVGVVQVYSSEPRDWTEEHFRVIGWLAAQASLLIETSNLQTELDQRRHDAEQAAARKTQFLAAVSHDVRTPANAIGLLAELIVRSGCDPQLAPKVPQLAADLKANARALVELVSDVLDLTRFDSGSLDLRLTDFSLPAMVHAEVRQLAPLARAKGLQLQAEICDEMCLHSDRMKLSRVLANIIGNAIKFTETGGITVKCQRLSDGTGELQVIDTGPGIAPADLRHIFNEFHQLRNPERDRTKGTGLGLAICKRLVQALGCKLCVESNLGQGTTFTVRIPASIMCEPQEQPQPATLPPPGGRLAGKQVLLVEDHEITRRVTAQLLASEGATVLQAETGGVALHMLNHESPEILLLDLMLPDMDGQRVLERLQQHRPPSLRRIFVVSGDTSPAREKELSAMGMNGMLAKPIDVEALIRACGEEGVPQPV